jgi:outer membrane protein
MQHSPSFLRAASRFSRLSACLLGLTVSGFFPIPSALAKTTKKIPVPVVEMAPLPPLHISTNDTLPPVNSSLPTLTLEEAQKTALDTSPTLRDYRSRRAEARFKVDEAYTIVAPNISVGANYTEISPSVAVNFGGMNIVAIAAHNYDVTLTLQQAIYTFGRLKWSAANAELLEKASKADLAYQQSRVLEDATVAYYMAGEASEQVRIAEQNYNARRGHLADSQALVNAGAAAPYDVKRDESALATAEQQLLEAQNKRALALVQLYTIMGIGQDGREPVRAAFSLTPPPELASIVSVVSSRQDLEAERWAREAAVARVSLAHTGNAPRLDFDTDYSRRNAITFTPDHLFEATIQFSFPIFDQGLTRTKVDQAKEVVEQLSAQYDNAVRQVKLELESYYLDIVNRWKRLDSAQRALDAAQEAERIAVLRYQNGLSQNIETLDAESTLTQAQQDLLTARYEYLISWAHYRRAGGL